MSSGGKKDVFESVLPKLMQTIRASSALGAQDVNFYKSIDAQLSEEIDGSAKRLMELTQQVIQVSGESNSGEVLKFGKDHISGESGWKPLADILDGVFEKLDNAFDNITRKNKPTKENSEMTYLEEGEDDGGLNVTSKRIEKPQLKFRVPVDNSESGPFKPRITSKPHSIQPYEEAIKMVYPEPVLEDEIEVIDPPFYPQPYGVEIDTQPYPESILKKEPPIPSKDWNSTTATWVDTPEKLSAMIQELSGSTEIAVDLEHHDYRSYYGIVCLMQISNREQDWIVDTLSLRDDLEPLNQIFADPSIVKVFHGAFMDIIWLQRDLGLYIVSLFDTYHASRVLGLPRFSLAYLLETFANFKTSKKYQLADWRIRPLIPAMMAYARSDTHFLLNIYDQLRNKLIDLGNDSLQKVLYESRQVAKRRFEYTPYRPLTNKYTTSGSKVSCPVMSNNPREPYSSIMVQYNVPHYKKALVAVLYEWRDRIAKQEDESVRFVMSNQLLVSLANLNRPIDTQKVLTASNFVSEYVRLNARELAELLEKTAQDTEEHDWDLVDQWKEASGEPEDVFEGVDTTKANGTAEKFEQLLKINSELIPTTTTTKVSLLNGKSNLFNNILENGKNLMSVEFDPAEDKVIRHNFSAEYGERLIHAIEGLADAEKSNEVQVQEVEEAKPVEQPEPVAEKEEESESESEKEKRQDPNEIITLKKKTPRNKHVIKNKPEETGPKLDYASADKIMLETNRRKDRKDNKKRAFNPYGKDSEGPQPSKKSRRVNSGKTSTFTKKR